jgi:hypothetical protein
MTASAPSVGTAQFTDEFLESLRNEGDPPADEAVTTFFDGRSDAPVDLFRSLVAATAGQTDESSPGIGPFVERQDPWPSWAVRPLVERGQELFGSWGPQFGLGLWMACLPADYAGAKGAVPLVLTTRLTKQPKRRFLETGQMILDAMTPGGLDPGAKGYAAVRHVRLMHAAVRHVLLHPQDAAESTDEPLGPWDESLGTPLNQEDLLGALFSFSVVGLQAVRRSGVRLSAADQDAYVHLWCVLGHQMGIRDGLLPLDRDDAQVVFDRICQRQYAPSAEGRELTEAAVACMQELLVIDQLRGLPATGIRHYLGNETADLLGVGKADWTRVFFLLESQSDNILGRTLGLLPCTQKITGRLGRDVFRAFEAAERGGRPSFQISDELRQAWGLDS